MHTLCICFFEQVAYLAHIGGEDAVNSASKFFQQCFDSEEEASPYFCWGGVPSRNVHALELKRFERACRGEHSFFNWNSTSN